MKENDVLTKKANVYWLHLPTHSDVLSEGYVGVSFNTHKSLANSGLHENPHLLNAIIKSGNTILQDIIAVGTEEYCYKLEAKLRPVSDVGWNISPGGTNPPNSKGRVSGFKGKQHTTEEKQKRSKRYSGTGNPFYGKRHLLESKERAGVKPIGFIPSNAINIEYHGVMYNSLAEASRETKISIYYLKKYIDKQYGGNLWN